MTNFESILDTPVTEIPRSKPLPTGTYQWVVQGQAKQDVTPPKPDGGGNVPYVEFNCVCQGPVEGQDEDALEEFGPDRIVGTRRRLTFYFSEKMENPTRDISNFLFKALGIEFGMSLRQAIAEAPNRQFLGTVTHEIVTPKDRSRETYITDRISATAAL